MGNHREHSTEINILTLYEAIHHLRLTTVSWTGPSRGWQVLEAKVELRSSSKKRLDLSTTRLDRITV
jgi:hypothetical protein